MRNNRPASYPFHYLHCADRDVRDVVTNSALWRYSIHAPTQMVLVAVRTRKMPGCPTWGDWTTACDHNERVPVVQRVAPGTWIVAGIGGPSPLATHATPIAARAHALRAIGCAGV